MRLIALGSNPIDLFAVFVAVSKVFLLLTKNVIDIVDNCPKLFRARYSKIGMFI